MKKIVFLITMLLILGGCKVEDKQEYSKEEVKQEMLSYVEEKYYDKEFEIYDIEWPWLIMNVTTMRLKVKGDPLESIFNVERYVEDSKVIIKDNYSEYLYQYELNNLLNPIAYEIFGDNFGYSFFINEIKDYKYNPDLTVEEVIKQYPTDINITLYLDESHMGNLELVKENMKKYHEELKKLCHPNMRFDMYVRICDGERYQENKEIMIDNNKTYQEKMDSLTILLPDPPILKTYSLSFINDYRIEELAR